MITKSGLLVSIFVLVVLGGFAQSSDHIVLRGPKMAPVSFNHSTHMSLEAGCTSCHHPSNAEKPNTEEHGKCGSCHTVTSTAPMKTNWRDAFHNVSATKGICIDCHRQANQAGKKAPLQCRQCHVASTP